MSRQSFLYFHAPGSGVAPALLARDYTGLYGVRLLWRVLLGATVPYPNPSKEALDGITGSALQTSAVAALDRFRLFSDFVLSHPLIYQVPELPVFLDSVQVFLQERIAPFA